MALDLLSQATFAGPAFTEPFVRYELEHELAARKLLPREAGAEGRELQASWETYRRYLRELVALGGAVRVRNHVLEPLVGRLGYARFEPADDVTTREGQEPGGYVMLDGDGTRLRTWAVDFGEDLDAPARRGRAYRFSHSRIAQRVLLATGEQVGLLTNGLELRLLISNPAGRDSQIEIPIDPQWKRSRDVPDTYRLLLALASPAGVRAVPDLVEKARLQQTRVTKELRVQARQAVERFVQEVLDHPDNADKLAAITDRGALARQLWREGLILVYRLLFILKSEASDDPAQGFSFASTSLWRNTFSPSVALAPYARAVLDNGAETGGLLEGGLRALFRMFETGLTCTELNVKPLGGFLFGADRTPLLSGLAWGERAVAYLLDRLLWTPRRRGSDARERVHYGPLDVKDLGRVYEALLELEPGIAGESMCRLRRRKLEVVIPLAQGVRYQVPGVRDRASGFRGQGKGGGDERGEELSGFGGVAAGDGAGGGVLPADAGVSAERDVRADKPIAPGSGIGAGEHRGGPRPEQPEGVSPTPLDRLRLPDGTGNPPPDRRAAALSDSRSTRRRAESRVGDRQDAQQPDAELEGEDLTPDPWDLEPDEEPEDENNLTPETRSLKPDRVEWVEEIPAGRFYLRVGLGRKSSGSFYTPDSFVTFLVQETLGPLVERLSPHDDPRPLAILSLKVGDDACGSGHFLVESDRFLGDKLYEACRACDERALEAERRAEAARSEDERQAALAEAASWRGRVAELPDPNDELLMYLPSRAPEGAESGVSQRKALALCKRLVAVHCLYGVDKNPLAVELARLALWIETQAEGLPLTFLDHRIVVGDSLTGPFFEHLLTTPGSQQPLEDLFSQGLRTRFAAALGEALAHVRDLEATVGATLAEIAAKQAAKARLDRALAPFRIVAAAWAGGVMLGLPRCDDEAYRRLARSVTEEGSLPDDLSGEDALRAMIARGLGVEDAPAARDELVALLASGRCVPALPFELIFPEVFFPTGELADRRGFHAKLGNPPWEGVDTSNKEFFAAFDMAILDLKTDGEIQALIKRLMENPDIASQRLRYEEDLQAIKNASKALLEFVSQGRTTTSGATPDLYQCFAERCTQLLRDGGYLGLVLPSAFHANESATGLRRLYLEQMALQCCYSFENRRRLFEIHGSYKFAVVVATKGQATGTFRCAFYLHDDEWLFAGHDGALTYSREFVRATTGRSLNFLELKDPIEVAPTLAAYRAAVTTFGELRREQKVTPTEELHKGKQKWRFVPIETVYRDETDPRQNPQLAETIERGYLPLIEGKTFHQFTNVWEGRPEFLVPLARMTDKTSRIESAMTTFRLVFRKVASSTNERTGIFTILPPGVVCTDSALVESQAISRKTYDALALCALANCFVFDWLLRQMVAANVQFSFLDIIPVPDLNTNWRFLAHCTTRLVSNDPAYAPLWREQLGNAWREPAPPFTWPVLAGDDARWAVRAAIDAVVAQAYGLDREQYAHVLSTFSHRSYPKAPELCLARFDELAEVGLDAFTRKWDPYWDVPLNESLPVAVIEIPGVGDQVAGDRSQGVMVKENGAEYRVRQLGLGI